MRRALFRQLLAAAVGGAVLAVAMIVLAGYIKFTILGDDIYLDGTAVAPDDLVARWVEPVPGQEDAEQGFELYADGTARSINMATLVYERWRLEESALVLIGRSIGNSVTSNFTETLPIVTVGPHEMTVIAANDSRRTYRRRPPSDVEETAGLIPACRPTDVARAGLRVGDWMVPADAVRAVRWQHDADVGGRILLALTDAGRDALERVTAAAIGQVLPVVIAGDAVTAPVVRERISSGQIVVAVDESAGTVRSLATAIAPSCP